jgi:hypothetical protein
MTQTTYTPAVFITGADERGNQFAFWKIYDGRWCDAYNMGEVTDEFAKKNVIPNAVTVQFSEAVMTRQEWIENDCPMRMTAEQIARWCKSGIELADEVEAKQAAQDCGCITCVSNLHNIETDNEANRRYFTDKLIADRHNAAKHTMKEVV